ncbi:MAG: mandelate racemase/muconate lactonizing enzyme family protein [Cyclobacteriaceae bacterium]|nr:mandelate racemase/muconate lactonizing enzyme family protein [Cyclobacteriaceae bacterium HetDA_MAG_MS6]
MQKVARNRRTFISSLLSGQTIREYEEQMKKSRLSDLKITDIKAYHPKPEKDASNSAVYVKVETDAGLVGWGEADKDYKLICCDFIEKVLKPHYLGQDPFQIDRLWNYAFFKSYDEGAHGLLAGAISGIDIALWDLKARALEVPVYKLLGGKFQDKIKLYGSFGANVKRHERSIFGHGGKKTPKEMAGIARDYVEKGYQAVKVRMQIRQLNIDPNPDPSFETVKAVREAIGDDITLFFDANNGYTAHRAIEQGQKLRNAYNIATIEEPVTMNNYHELREVTQALDFPITAGEHEYNRWHFRDLITIGGVDILNPDLIKSSGISECKKIAAVCQAFDKRFMIHNAYPGIATAAALHFVTSCPNASEYQEYAGPRYWMGLQKYFKNELIVEDGYLRVPETPGLGLEIDEEAIVNANVYKP